MMLSITTDFAADTGCPEPHLRRIADAGFSHIHWCHQWDTDFLYDPAEIEQIGRWLGEFGLCLLDLHASSGREKGWASTREYERLAGVALVKNRIDFVETLGGDAIVMHIPDQRDRAREPRVWDQLLRSLDDLRPYAQARGIRIAIENGVDNFAVIRELFDAYSPDYLGMCYDCGHGNMALEGMARCIGLDELETMKHRLIVVHLHDNDGRGDLHRIPFTGTVDWPRLARIMAASSYRKPVSMESNMHREDTQDPVEFLSRAYAAGARLTGMIAQAG